MKEGTIVDAPLIAAPSSTKNAEQTRDPEMSATKKGPQWHFGMKAHIGVVAQGGRVHAMEASTAKVHDCSELEALLHALWVVQGVSSATSVTCIVKNSTP